MGLRKRDSIAGKILLYLGETSKELLELGVDMIVDPHVFLQRGGYKKERRIQQVANFKRSRYVYKKKGRWVLTSLGRIEAIKLNVLSRYPNAASTWDGKWLLVLFDVSEETRRDRSLLRRELRALGFLELQRSVWITPLPIRDELLCLLKLWDLEIKKGDIRIVVAESLYREADIRRKFGLLALN